jgi:hypothetical protein
MTKTLLAIGLLTMLTVACSRKPDPQDQCVRNMHVLWEACRSYRLSESISPTQAIDPRSLSAYVRPQDQEMRCPSGKKAYAAFSFHDGPKCPNSDEHTKVLQAGAKSK